MLPISRQKMQSQLVLVKLITVSWHYFTHDQSYNKIKFMMDHNSKINDGI